MWCTAASRSSVTSIRSRSRALIVPAIRHAIEQVTERLPVFGADQHDRKVLDLAGLHERQGLRQLVERPETSRQRHEGVRVLEEQHLANEEVAARHRPIEIAVRRLLERQFDVAADRPSAGFTGAAIGRLHQPRAAAGHHGESETDERGTQVTGHRVVGVRLRIAGRAEDGHTGPGEVQGAKPGDEVPHGAQHQPQFPVSGVRSLEENVLLAAGRFAGRVVLQARESLHRRCAPFVASQCNKAAVRLAGAACGRRPRAAGKSPGDRETFPGGRQHRPRSGPAKKPECGKRHAR